ncbi:MAG: sigma-54-dependent transcriptional regulator [Arenimonas sp.]
MQNPVALIVDDERDIRDLLSTALSRMGLDVVSAESIQQAKTLLSEGHFDLCLTDMRLGDGSGIELIGFVSEHYRNMPIAMITAYGDVPSAVNALKAGAYDFVSKPVDLGTLRKLVEQALALREQHRPPVSDMVGESTGLKNLRDQIERLARSLAPILIVGEAGVGKQVVAKQIHQQSPRNRAPFLEVECDAIEADQLDAVFFGKAGAFLMAQGGTLFIDHVDALPLTFQIKLHKTIQDRSIRAIGAFADTPIDVRIISATRKDLAQEANGKRFRHDLLYRINVIELLVPPLRERREDILPLAHAFLAELAAHSGTQDQMRLSEAAEALLLQYSFPGNVRELENILERATVLATGTVIDAENLQFNRPEPSESGGGIPKALPEALEQLERAQIQAALEACRFNKTKAAAQLGITFRALRYKMEKLGME